MYPLEFSHVIGPWKFFIFSYNPLEIFDSIPSWRSSSTPLYGQKNSPLCEMCVKWIKSTLIYLHYLHKIRTSKLYSKTIHCKKNKNEWNDFVFNTLWRRHFPIFLFLYVLVNSFIYWIERERECGVTSAKSAISSALIIIKSIYIWKHFESFILLFPHFFFFVTYLGLHQRGLLDETKWLFPGINNNTVIMNIFKLIDFLFCFWKQFFW